MRAGEHDDGALPVCGLAAAPVGAAEDEVVREKPSDRIQVDGLQVALEPVRFQNYRAVGDGCERLDDVPQVFENRECEHHVVVLVVDPRIGDVAFEEGHAGCAVVGVDQPRDLDEVRVVLPAVDDIRAALARRPAYLTEIGAEVEHALARELDAIEQRCAVRAKAAGELAVQLDRLVMVASLDPRL